MKIFGPLFIGCYFASYPVFFILAWGDAGFLIASIFFLFTIVWFLAYFYFKKKGKLTSPWLMLPGIIIGVYIILAFLYELLAHFDTYSFSKSDISTILIVIAAFLPFLTLLSRKKKN